MRVEQRATGYCQMPTGWVAEVETQVTIQGREPRKSSA